MHSFMQSCIHSFTHFIRSFIHSFIQSFTHFIQSVHEFQSFFISFTHCQCVNISTTNLLTFWSHTRPSSTLFFLSWIWDRSVCHMFETIDSDANKPKGLIVDKVRQISQRLKPSQSLQTHDISCKKQNVSVTKNNTSGNEKRADASVETGHLDKQFDEVDNPCSVTGKRFGPGLLSHLCSIQAFGSTIPCRPSAIFYHLMSFH